MNKNAAPIIRGEYPTTVAVIPVRLASVTMSCVIVKPSPNTKTAPKAILNPVPALSPIAPFFEFKILFLLSSWIKNLHIELAKKSDNGNGIKIEPINFENEEQGKSDYEYEKIELKNRISNTFQVPVDNVTVEFIEWGD